VTARRRRERPAPWGPGIDREAARALLHRRLSQFATVMFWIFWLLVAFVIAFYRLWPTTRPARADLVHAVAVVGLIALAALWFIVLRRHQVSIEALYLVDALQLLLIGGVLGLAVYVNSDLRAAVYSAFVWHIFVVFSRAIIVPSSGRRTAAVSALSFAPMAVAAALVATEMPERLEIPAPAFLLAAALFAAVAVVLAATGSDVIYGLRRAVSEARQLGPYVLDEKIGEGGMGVVYRARHAMLRRPTAIKLVQPEKVDAGSLARFEREVHHMSRLTHPNAVTIFDYGRSVDGVFYYAMEYLDGVDLETLVKRDGPQPAPRVIRILRQVCGALDEAHAMGLIHRDIKPANIILCQRGRQPDIAKVVDFGLVRELPSVAPAPAAEDSPSSSAPLAIAGTPSYIAPEAVTDPGQVGPQSDLYSLGAVGYFLLTGCPVFEGRTAVDLCVQHVSCQPVPPSARTDRLIPADLEALILACLAKVPSQRPAGAGALRAALSRLPSYRDWDAGLALAWWHAFEAHRMASNATSAERTLSGAPVTILVDGTGRDVMEAAGATAERRA
jgi:eukaryotic-like serine/threonine-protein kinase